MKLKSKLAVAATGLLALGGAGTGAVLTASAAPAAPAHIQTISATQVAPPATPAPPTQVAPPATPAPPETDNVQSGDQTTPDNPADAAAEAETAGATEATTANDGPGGHQDPPGNVDNQSTTEQ